MLALPPGSYLAIVVVSLLGLYLLDRTHKLAFTVDPRRAFLSMLPAFIVFLVWDIAGIALDIFFRGNNSLLTGLQILPEFPVEEIFFLMLLCYSSLIALTWISKVLNKK